MNPADFADEHFGIPTISDILKELDKPGRDPRPEFKTANFKDGVEKLSDLTPGMLLEGVDHQRHQLWCLCRYWRAPGRFSAYLVANRQICQSIHIRW